MLEQQKKTMAVPCMTPLKQQERKEILHRKTSHRKRDREEWERKKPQRTGKTTNTPEVTFRYALPPPPSSITRRGPFHNKINANRPFAPHPQFCQCKVQKRNPKANERAGPHEKKHNAGGGGGAGPGGKEAGLRLQKTRVFGVLCFLPSVEIKNACLNCRRCVRARGWFDSGLWIRVWACFYVSSIGRRAPVAWRAALPSTRRASVIDLEVYVYFSTFLVLPVYSTFVMNFNFAVVVFWGGLRLFWGWLFGFLFCFNVALRFVLGDGLLMMPVVEYSFSLIMC
ncbi:protein transport protein Sec23A, putative [Trypanosoma cruzi marinkellei]|uniref:Protein transport protein Sec23A, putative n=1 Tax=Trypanosoma cruzi marinkellei TaxID=85056 RepID=K2M084_TRYCR|nr:protein transport protein Sec23A, putative [Trypanosoma cruzi marinkellei]